jgi:hypothetical protein
MNCSLNWFCEWQDLAGAVLGGGALVWTVWLTLSSEQRKSKEESRALRIALGVELRQCVRYVLKGYQNVVSLIESGSISTSKTLRDSLRFPDPVIYPKSASRVGVLGEHTHMFVEFYCQLWSVPDGVYERYPEESKLQRAGLVGVAESLLELAEIGIKALPAFAGMPGSELDGQLQKDTAEARAEIMSLKDRTPEK